VHALRVNQATSYVQYGDLTFYDSTYEDFLPLKDPLAKPQEKKFNLKITIYQNQSYYFLSGGYSLTYYSLYEGW
jgi:hypothetical protein